MSRPGKRAGFSLMEVLLATAILLGSVFVLMELAGIGRHYVQSVEARTTAQLLCQSKLNELLAGAARVEEVQQRPLEDNPDWVYSVETMPVRGLDLLSVRVTVTELREEQPGQPTRGKPKSFTLVRWVPNPQSGRRQQRQFADSSVLGE